MDNAALHHDFFLLLPEVQLVLFGLGILLTDFLLEDQYKYWNAVMALLGVAFSGFSLWRLRDLPPDASVAFHYSILVDPFYIFFGALFLAATALVILLSVKYLSTVGENHGEYYALLLFATVGMMFMAAGIDLVVQFLGLETMALSFYVLVGFLRRDKRSNEAAVKYFLLGAFSSGILAYGFSLLYGISATADLKDLFGPDVPRTSLAAVNAAVQIMVDQHGAGILLVMLALVTVAVGLFFKVAAVPFHQWAPDVYEGAPTTITAYVSVASKTASFALLLRLFLTAFWPARVNWEMILVGVAVASLTLGNFAALTQTNVKRMLAYSSISHVGYILLGLVAGNETGLVGISYYLMVYVFMTAGAFGVLIVLQRRGLAGDELDDLNGLYRRSPVAALLLLIFMLSLAGIPPLAGFMGKYFIFLALIQAQHYTLAVFAALYIVPALYYYFRVVVHAWLKDGTDHSRVPISMAQTIAMTVMCFVTLAAGIYPEPFVHLAGYSIFLPLGPFGH
ncbi:MAG: NADH-quinone oxidoreductase subunit N [Candidatus Acidiferrales bacterium]